MSGIRSLRHTFVEFIPESLDDGVLYISLAYATVNHRCCCGCGREVVTPLSPSDWRLIFDGRSISLEPSIGNWSFPCRSHYWITRGQVRWAAQWSREQVEACRTQSRPLTHQAAGEATAAPARPAEAAQPALNPRRSLWRRFWDHLRLLRDRDA